MKEHLPPIPSEGAVVIGTDVQTAPPTGRSIGTRDHDLIQKWAERHSAEPAFEEHGSVSNLTDAHCTVRFNFPGLNKYRPVSWAQWWKAFQEQHLVFVYEEDVADRAYELWQSRGARHGQDQEDWFQAERQLQEENARPTGGYRFSKEL